MRDQLRKLIINQELKTTYDISDGKGYQIEKLSTNYSSFKILKKLKEFRTDTSLDNDLNYDEKNKFFNENDKIFLRID